MATFTAIFGAKGHLSMAQEAARAVLIFAYGLALVRIAGRRVFGKWSALDIIVSIVIGSNLSRALTGSAPLAGTLVASALVMVLHWVLAVAAAKWRWASILLEGRPIDLLRDGRVSHARRIRHGVSDADLEEAMRAKGIGAADAVQAITLEPSGKLNIRT